MTLAEALRIDDAWWPRPHRGGHRHTVGARSVEATTWMRPRPHDETLVAWRRASLDRHGRDAFAALPGTEDAGRAVAVLLGVEQFSVIGEEGRHPLDAAGRAVAEDLCLVDVTGVQPVLAAGSVAMPSGWLISGKLGLPMLDVHGPVHGYAEQIGAASDALMQKLTPGRIVARVNWSMQSDPELFRPPSIRRPGVPAPPRSVPDDVRLRIEYQTLRRVTEGTVLFTIRTACEPLAALTDRPGLITALHGALAQLPEVHRRYKGMAGFADDALRWLAGQHVPPARQVP